MDHNLDHFKPKVQEYLSHQEVDGQVDKHIQQRNHWEVYLKVRNGKCKPQWIQVEEILLQSQKMT